jgi:hypothetical protein
MQWAAANGVPPPGTQDVDTTMTGTIHTSRTATASAPRSPIRTALAIALCLAATGTLAACGGKERKSPDMAASRITTIGVNSYLWRASLDALSFMPLLQADSSGGVIVTDWYSNPSNPGERVKISVTILDQDLRADALRIAASREVSRGGTWVGAPVQAATVQKLEDVILTRARDLRRSAMGG